MHRLGHALSGGIEDFGNHNDYARSSAFGLFHRSKKLRFWQLLQAVPERSCASQSLRYLDSAQSLLHLHITAWLGWIRMRPFPSFMIGSDECSNSPRAALGAGAVWRFCTGTSRLCMAMCVPFLPANRSENRSSSGSCVEVSRDGQSQPSAKPSFRSLIKSRYQANTSSSRSVARWCLADRKARGSDGDSAPSQS